MRVDALSKRKEEALLLPWCTPNLREEGGPACGKEALQKAALFHLLLWKMLLVLNISVALFT